MLYRGEIETFAPPIVGLQREVFQLTALSDARFTRVETELGVLALEIRDGLAETNRRFDGFAKGLIRQTERIDALVEGLAQTNKRLDGVVEGLAATNERLDGLTERVDGLAGQVTQLQTDMDEVKSMLKTLLARK